MGTQCLDRGAQAVGRMGIVDIDGRARLADDRAFQAAAHRLDPAQQFQHLGGIAAGRDDQTGRRQRIGRLIGADQRQIDLVELAIGFDFQRLAQLGRGAVGKTQCLPLHPDAQHTKPPLRSPLDRLVRPFIVGPDHGRAAIAHDFVEQAHLGVEIAVHVAMIIEMIARQVGEGAGRNRQPLGAILVEAMARRLERGMGDALALEARHVGEEGDDVRRGEAGRHLIDRGGDAQRPDRGRLVAQHAPQLARQFDRAGLAIGAGDGDGHIREWREIARGQLREQAAGIGVGDMHRALDLRLRPGDDRDRTRLHRIGNKILTIDAQALKGTEDGARRDLAIVDGKTRHGRVEAGVAIDLDAQLLD